MATEDLSPAEVERLNIYEAFYELIEEADIKDNPVALARAFYVTLYLLSLQERSDDNAIAEYQKTLRGAVNRRVSPDLRIDATTVA